MKATQLLVTQHQKVKAIFKKLESGRSDPPPLLRELADSLGAHMAIEQNIFYPAIRELKEDLVAESFEEHAIAELALKRLIATPPSKASFIAKVTTLKELIEHHVKEEEEDLFPVVEKKMDPDRLNELGKAMKAAFEEAMTRGFEALVPKSMGQTSADLANKPHPKKRAVKNGHAASAAKS